MSHYNPLNATTEQIQQKTNEIKTESSLSKQFNQIIKKNYFNYLRMHVHIQMSIVSFDLQTSKFNPQFS